MGQLRREVAEGQERRVAVLEELERVRGELEDRTGRATDAGPVVRLKSALRGLRKEIRSMDSRIGLALSMVSARRQERDA